MNNSHRLIWVDLETTGLDLDKDEILEIATVVTDGDLREIAVGPVLPVYQPDHVLNVMPEWCLKTHGESGLIEACRTSPYSVRIAELKTLEFVAQHVSHQASPLCGSSVWTDRIYLRRLMPDLERHFHYRCLDVSSFKEALNRWRPEIAREVSKARQHRSLADIRESIAELRFYREALNI